MIPRSLPNSLAGRSPGLHPTMMGWTRSPTRAQKGALGVFPDGMDALPAQAAPYRTDLVLSSMRLPAHHPRILMPSK